MDNHRLDQSLSKMEPALRQKVALCQGILRRHGRVVVAFSGGVDSTFLLALACGTLGRADVLAVHGVSPIFPAWERDEARALAKDLGAELLEVPTCQMEDALVLANPPDRCYHCKLKTFSRLQELAAQKGFAVVASGTNADDTGDYRPGMKAEQELQIARPLLEAGLSKQEIRQAARSMDLPIWSKPTYACLATRIPYGSPITARKLQRIEQGEMALRKLGFEGSRLRDHDDVARLEVPVDQIERAAAMRQSILAAIKPLGYAYVALDLQGYRTGAMNEVL